MPLSEEELRLLEQMEQALAQEDPKFASTLRGSAVQRGTKVRTAGAAVGFLAGIAMLMGGAMSQQIWLGVLGFVVMTAAAFLGLLAWKGHGAAADQPQAPTPDQGAGFGLDDPPHRFGVIEGGRAKRRAPKASRRPSEGTFMQRMEQRWERRRQQGF